MVLCVLSPCPLFAMLFEPSAYRYQNDQPGMCVGGHVTSSQHKQPMNTIKSMPQVGWAE